MILRLFALALALSLPLQAGCGESAADSQAATEATGDDGLGGAPATPPFAVSGDLDGLLLVWFDEEGPHRATNRDDVPEEHREYVRVDSLRAAPDDRLDPELVYVADIRAPGEGGAYVVRTARREAYDALVDQAQGVAPLVAEVIDDEEDQEDQEGQEGQEAPTANREVVIYGADWCPACRASARFFTERGVPFVEKNVERDPAARAEMNQKAQAAGVRPSGIPVIDFRGTILTGFDQGRLEALIAAGT